VGALGSMVALERYAICYYRRYMLALCMGVSNYKLFVSKKEVKSALNLWTLGLKPKRVQVHPKTFSTNPNILYHNPQR